MPVDTRWAERSRAIARCCADRLTALLTATLTAMLTDEIAGRFLRFGGSQQHRRVSTLVRHIDHGITVSGDTSFGSLIHAMLGSAGGTGGWRTKRSGCSA